MSNQTLPYHVIYEIIQYIPDTCNRNYKFKLLNKYFNNMFNPCLIKSIKIKEQLSLGCFHHSPTMYEIITELKKLSSYNPCIHFSNQEICSQAKPYVMKLGYVISHSCCYGTGLVTRPSLDNNKWIKYQLSMNKNKST